MVYTRPIHFLLIIGALGANSTQPAIIPSVDETKNHHTLSHWMLSGLAKHLPRDSTSTKPSISLGVFTVVLIAHLLQLPVLVKLHRFLRAGYRKRLLALSIILFTETVPIAWLAINAQLLDSIFSPAKMPYPASKALLNTLSDTTLIGLSVSATPRKASSAKLRNSFRRWHHASRYQFSR